MVPFLSTRNYISVEQFKTDVKTSNFVPTKDFINVKADAAVTLKIGTSEEMLRAAAENFLNWNTDDISAQVTDVLEGNLREIAKSSAVLEIETERQRKTIEYERSQADITKQEQEALVVKKSVEVERQHLEADVKAKADAEKYKKEREAEAQLALSQREAEAEGLEKKAEALAKMDKAGIAQMYFEVLPQVVAAAAQPLANVDSITMYGDDNSSKMIGDIMRSISTINEGSGMDVRQLFSGLVGANITGNAIGRQIKSATVEETVTNPEIISE